MIISTPSDRKIIPRWRNSTLTVLTGETDSLKTCIIAPSLELRSELNNSIAEWKNKPFLSQAVELITLALIYDKPECCIDAIHYVLNDHVTEKLPKQLARQLLTILDPHYKAVNDTLFNLEDSINARRTISELRNSLRYYPRNPLVWADLAHAQATLGQPDKADRSMRIALASSPPNRVILRSASRLYVHRDEPDRAHRLLFRAEAVKDDPWLLAAEVATASVAKRTSRLIQHAKRLINYKNIDPFHVTELAGALATLEMEAGKDRMARKLFHLSLIKPTDNSVAQAKWASHHLGKFEVKDEDLKIDRGYEARAQHAYLQGDWNTSIRESWDWLRDEPYSSKPAIFGSYIASVGNWDFNEAKRIARAGIKANPNNPVLRNNLVFSLVNLGRIDEAIKEFKRIKHQQDPTIQIILLATKGLLNYRKGNIAKGRSLYNESLDKARQTSNYQALRLASIFFAREEILAKSPTAQQAISKALRITKAQKPTPELTQWLELLQGMVT